MLCDLLGGDIRIVGGRSSAGVGGDVIFQAGATAAASVGGSVTIVSGAGTASTSG